VINVCVIQAVTRNFCN